MPRLSVCLFTDAPPERVAVIVGAFDGLGAQVVLAVDDRVPEDRLQAYGALGDRLFLAPYAGPPERGFPWLHAQCDGDWIMRVDGDEVPNARLTAEIDALIRAPRSVTHATMRRRWLSGGPDRYLAAWPWEPDRQIRLVRNDAALVHVPGTMHTSVQVAGAGRYLDGCLYHADLLGPLSDRRAKVARYRGRTPDIRLAGRDMNEAYYLPEDLPSLRLADVPGEDLTRVRAFVDPPRPRPRGVAGAPPQRVTREDVDALWPGRPLADADHVASIEVLEGDLRVWPGESRTFDLRVRNGGGATWPWGGAGTPEIRLGQRWHLPDGTVLDGARTPFGEAVGPGESVRLAASATPPPVGGPLRLEFDVVHEHVRWFGCGVTFDVSS